MASDPPVGITNTPQAGEAEDAPPRATPEPTLSAASATLESQPTDTVSESEMPPRRPPDNGSIFTVLHSFNRAVWGNAPLALVVAFFLGGLLDSDIDRARVLFIIAWAIGTLAILSAQWTLRIGRGPIRWTVRLFLSLCLAGMFYLVDARAMANKEATELHLHFKPGDLSASQRRAITHALYGFRTYLKGTGFPVADHLPRLALAPVRIMNGRSVSTPAMSLGGEQMFIQLAPDSKDIPKNAMLRYAQWEAMYALIKNNRLYTEYSTWGGAVSSYFIDSYLDHFTADSFYAMWEYVLWSIRSEFGKEFADGLAAYSIIAFQITKEKPPEPVNIISPVNNPVDNNFIAARLREGLIAMDTGSLDQKHIEAINKAFKKAGLIVDPLKP